MTICYDLRFPLLYKKLAKKGAHFFSIPAAFTYTTGISHWESLLRARAIENGCYVFAPAQCGYHDNGRRTFGNSMIIDPWGKILCRAKNSIGSISCDIDLEKVNFYRKRIPAMTEY
jgi:nitrilase